MRVLLPLLLLAGCPESPEDTPPVEASCVDATTLSTGEATVSCADAGQLCDPELAACVDPWRYGSPSFEACRDEPDATASSLADKAATYEERARTLHVHPELGWMMGVELDDGVDPATATWEDVVRWDRDANDGLWSSLYLASQAFRYAATEGDERAEALAMLRRMLEAELERMALSGVRGNLVRTYVKPGIDGLACPEDLFAYRSDVEKDDDKWIRVDEDGCLTWLPPEGQGDDWIVSDVCPGSDFAGWCFRDNTSKDEYAGHMFAMGAVLQLVDDETARAAAEQVVRAVLDELLENSLWMTDPDGRHTEHGDFSPAYGAGFNAGFTLGFLSIGAHGLDEPRYQTALDCFTGRHTGEDCPVLDPPFADPFQDVLAINAVHIDEKGCVSNDNNASMFLLALVDMIWFETDPELRAVYQATLRDIWEAPGFDRALGLRENAWYDVIWAAFKPLGPDTDGPAVAAVEEAACGLAVFPEDEVRREVPPFDAEQVCLDRLDRPMSLQPRGPHERCLEAFVWWKDQYILKGCDAEPTKVEPPADYLLPYWMGRAFGFVDAGW